MFTSRLFGNENVHTLISKNVHTTRGFGHFLSGVVTTSVDIFVECGYFLPGVVTTVSVDSFCGVEIFSQGVDIFSQGVDNTVL